MADISIDIRSNIFSYDNSMCDCKITTNYTEDGEVYYGFQVKAIDAAKKYAYTSRYGLVMIDKATGALRKEHNPSIIEELLSFDSCSATKIKEFIDKYGFFLPLPPDNKYRWFDHKNLSQLIKRFQILVKLMSAIEEKEIDYDNVVSLIASLLFSQPVSIAIDNSDIGWFSCNKIARLWYSLPSRQPFDYGDNEFSQLSYAPLDTILSYGDLPDLCRPLDDCDLDGFVSMEYDSYIVPDTFTTKNEAFSLYEHDETEYGLREPSNPAISFKSQIGKLYCASFSEAGIDDTRYIIDFFYHLLKTEISMELSNDGMLQTNISLINLPAFDEKYRERSILIAKLVIKAELDFALGGVHPTYNIDTMSPSFELPNFITALYFGLFYTRTSYEIFRQCANPNCTCVFKVSTTNSKKKYHSMECQNAVAQKKYQHKKKSQLSSSDIALPFK